MNEEHTKPLADENEMTSAQDPASGETGARSADEPGVTADERGVTAAEPEVTAEEPEVTADEAAAEPVVAEAAGPEEAANAEAAAPEGDPVQGDDAVITSTAIEPAPIDLTQVKRVLEAALLSSTDPLTVQQLKRLFGGEVSVDTVRKVLDELKGEWSERSIELTSVASGWRFRVKPEYQKFLDRISAEKPPRYSRAVLETLAIIAYRQPVTRGDIEDVRGVAVSPATLKALEERGWIETIGHRETPGRPALFATTKKFLDDLNLRSLEELPPLDELQAALEPAPTLVPLEAPPAPERPEAEDTEAPAEAQASDGGSLAEDTPEGDALTEDTPEGDAPTEDTPEGELPEEDTPEGDLPEEETPEGETVAEAEGSAHEAPIDEVPQPDATAEEPVAEAAQTPEHPESQDETER